MKNQLILASILITLSMPAMAEETMPHDMMNHGGHSMEGMNHNDNTEQSVAKSVRQVEASKVCMVNDKAFAEDQTAIVVNDKTYYGCCSMCEARLTKDEAIRSATDPISGKKVDKATAIIGADEAGKVYYFENETNLHKHMGHK